LGRVEVTDVHSEPVIVSSAIEDIDVVVLKLPEILLLPEVSREMPHIQPLVENRVA